jgi:hypothetical protein
MNLEQTMQNLKVRLGDNPCRGIVEGLNEEALPMQLAFIMGRSANSQNRVYEVKNEVVSTKAFDESKVEDPSLIIYPVMMSDKNGLCHVVSNGVQTKEVLRQIMFSNRSNKFGKFARELENWYCEPDAPTFTPRITGYSFIDSASRSMPVYLSVLAREECAREHWVDTIEEHGLSKAQFRKQGMTEAQVTEAFNQEVSRLSGLDHKHFPTRRNVYERVARPGMGYCVTTYRPGSKTLDPFVGEPFEVPIRGNRTEAMMSLWEQLEPGPDAKADLQKDWRVAIVCKSIDALDGVRYNVHNRHEATR